MILPHPICYVEAYEISCIGLLCTDITFDQTDKLTKLLFLHLILSNIESDHIFL